MKKFFTTICSVLIFTMGTFTVHAQRTPNGECVADFNGDSVVNLFDFVILSNNYLKQGNPITGDLNRDNIVNIFDFTLFSQSYLKSCTILLGSPSPTSQSSKGIWISQQELMALPTSGTAWTQLVSEAESSWGSADLGSNESAHDVKTLAGALVAVRKNDTAMRNKTIQGLQSAMNSPLSRSLELSRGLQSYVIAADIIGYRDAAFMTWVRKMLNEDVSPHLASDACNAQSASRSATGTKCDQVGGIVCTAINSVNNWGGHARASVAAAAIYLDDAALLEEVTRAHKSFNGEAVTNNLTCNDTNWHADATNRYGVNKLGTKINNIDVSGVLPEDWRRGGEFAMPPADTVYMWEGMQGYITTAIILDRAGKVPLSSGDNAVKRSLDILYRLNKPAEGDDQIIPWLANKYLGTNYPKSLDADNGKGIGWTDWTHQ